MNSKTPTGYGRNYVSPMLGSKNKPEILRAIATLGEMNDRHTAALGNRDRQALLNLAIEYETLGRHGGLPTMARIIRAEALGIFCPECDSAILPSQYCMMGHWCGERPAATDGDVISDRATSLMAV